MKRIKNFLELLWVCLIYERTQKKKLRLSWIIKWAWDGSDVSDDIRNMVLDNIRYRTKHQL